MESMNIQTAKLDLIAWISKLNDTSIIDKLSALKNDYSGSVDFWDELSQAEIDAIERGLADFENGRVHTHDEAKKVYEKYL